MRKHVEKLNEKKESVTTKRPAATFSDKVLVSTSHIEEEAKRSLIHLKETQFKEESEEGENELHMTWQGSFKKQRESTHHEFEESPAESPLKSMMSPGIEDSAMKQTMNRNQLPQLRVKDQPEFSEPFEKEDRDIRSSLLKAIEESRVYDIRRIMREADLKSVDMVRDLVDQLPVKGAIEGPANYSSRLWNPLLYAIYIQKLEVAKVLLEEYCQNVTISLRQPPIDDTSEYIIPLQTTFEQHKMN